MSEEEKISGVANEPDVPAGRKVLIELYISAEDWEDEQDMMDKAVNAAEERGLPVYNSDIKEVYEI